MFEKTLFPREGGGPSPAGTILNQSEMGPRLRGDTLLFQSKSRTP
jgi:hypothetical protein